MLSGPHGADPRWPPASPSLLTPRGQGCAHAPHAVRENHGHRACFSPFALTDASKVPGSREGGLCRAGPVHPLQPCRGHCCAPGGCRPLLPAAPLLLGTGLGLRGPPHGSCSQSPRGVAGVAGSCPRRAPPPRLPWAQVGVWGKESPHVTTTVSSPVKQGWCQGLRGHRRGGREVGARPVRPSAPPHTGWRP